MLGRPVNPSGQHSLTQLEQTFLVDLGDRVVKFLPSFFFVRADVLHL